MTARTDDTARAADDALSLMKADHDSVARLLRAFDALGDGEDGYDRKAALIDDICYELTIHAMLEEEIFYPALRAALHDDTLIDQHESEHAGIRELIARLEVIYPNEDHFDTTVSVLADELRHHIELEESTLFDAARKSGIDLAALGLQLLRRRHALDDDLTAPPAPVGEHAGARRTPRVPD